jgi:ferrous iron transport protein B
VGLLGLPAAVGITLVFGILRKELTIVMLVAALGTSNFGAVLTTGQMAVFTAFTMFYVPCLATLAMTRTLLGGKAVWVTIGFTTLVALAVALLFRAGFAIAG